MNTLDKINQKIINILESGEKVNTKKFLLVFFGIIALLLILSSNYISNHLTCVWTGGEFYIPKESTYSSFKVIEINSGSGDWWIYAEDNKNYYYNQSNENDYTVYSKDTALDCIGFKVNEYKTWCIESDTLFIESLIFDNNLYFNFTYNRAMI